LTTCSRIEERWDDEFTAGTKYYDAPGTSEVAVLSRQMLSAVAYIHHLSIVHRDQLVMVVIEVYPAW
jgi:hypothetical protein